MYSIYCFAFNSLVYLCVHCNFAGNTIYQLNVAAKCAGNILLLEQTLLYFILIY